jgi:hypothetical protein
MTGGQGADARGRAGIGRGPDAHTLVSPARSFSKSRLMSVRHRAPLHVHAIPSGLQKGVVHG